MAMSLAIRLALQGAAYVWGVFRLLVALLRNLRGRGYRDGQQGGPRFPCQAEGCCFNLSLGKVRPWREEKKSMLRRYRYEKGDKFCFKIPRGKRRPPGRSWSKLEKKCSSSLKKKFISDFLFQLGRRKSKIKRDFFTDGKGFFKSPCKTQVRWGIQTTHRGFKAEYGDISSMPAPPKVTA